MIYGEYATVTDVRSQYLSSTNTGDDALILKCIRQASRDMEAITNRWFAPRIETRYFDTPKGESIELGVDLLELTSLSNGDNTALTTTQYKLRPSNSTPKNEIIGLTTQMTWLLDSADGTRYDAIKAIGVWGYHPAYAHAWEAVTALASAITTTSATSVTVPKGLLVAGDFIKIDTEYLYISSLTAGATNDTLTVVRGVNGSTAATHLISAPVYRWVVDDGLRMLCAQAAAAFYKLRSNPTNETMTLDGVTFVTPKDVVQFLDKSLRELGLIRTGLS